MWDKSVFGLVVILSIASVALSFLDGSDVAETSVNDRDAETPSYLGLEFYLFVEENVTEGVGIAPVASDQCIVGKKDWDTTVHTYSLFEVAGVNLAIYGIDVNETGKSPYTEPVLGYNNEQVHSIEGNRINNDLGSQPADDRKRHPPPFELFEDFDISDMVTGEENWHDLLVYRKNLERPSLSFYVDKVARKRWLPSVGHAQPGVYLLSYDTELTSTGTVLDETAKILSLLPNETDFAAKPSHMSETMGTWLIRHDTHSGRNLPHTSVGPKAREGGSKPFRKERAARSLAEDLHKPPREYESWALHNVRPGIVVEELFTAHDDTNVPPYEFNIFTIWGRVWVGQMLSVVKSEKFVDGHIHRNGTMAHESAADKIPDWLDWPRLVRIAESLGANKDMFRTDVFVGVPSVSQREGIEHHGRVDDIVDQDSAEYDSADYEGAYDESADHDGAHYEDSADHHGSHYDSANHEDGSHYESADNSRSSYDSADQDDGPLYDRADHDDGPHDDSADHDGEYRESADHGDGLDAESEDWDSAEDEEKGDEIAATARLDLVQYVVSESEIFPTTEFFSYDVEEEAARLWIAGYKLGNFKTVPNTEVPREFLATGILSSTYYVGAKNE